MDRLTAAMEEMKTESEALVQGLRDEIRDLKEKAEAKDFFADDKEGEADAEQEAERLREQVETLQSRIEELEEEAAELRDKGEGGAAMLQPVEVCGTCSCRGESNSIETRFIVLHAVHYVDALVSTTLYFPAECVRRCGALTSLEGC